MYKVSLETMHTTEIEQENYDEDNFLDKMNFFFSSLDIKQYDPSWEDYEL